MNIKPHIQIGEPGQPITLYEGPLEVHVKKESDLLENSRIVFVFLPEPRIEFYFKDSTFFDQNLFDLSADCKIKLPEHDTFINVIPISQSISFGKQPPKPQVIALQKRKIEWSSTVKLSHIKFYLANFFQILSPIELKSNEWRISIRRQKKITDIAKYLEYSHDYAVTHIGTIKNIQSNKFDLKSTDDMAELTVLFLIGFRMKQDWGIGLNLVRK